MQNYVMFAQELCVDTINYLYTLPDDTDLYVIGELLDKRYFRALISLKVNVYYISTSKYIIECEEDLPENYTVVTEYDVKYIYEVLKKFNNFKFSNQVSNFSHNTHSMIENSIKVDSEICLGKSESTLWTDLFKSVHNDIRVLVSANALTKFYNTTDVPYVNIYFTNEEILPDVYKKYKTQDCYRFSLEDDALKSVERRFIRGVTININKIEIFSNIEHLVLNNDIHNSIILDKIPTASEYDEIYTRVLAKELLLIYYTNDKIKSNLEEKGLGKITRRWRYES